jgi:hypothetical protein
MNHDFLFPWPTEVKYSNPNFMPVTKFKHKYMGMIKRIPGANKLPMYEDEHLFRMVKKIEKYLQNPKYRVVSVYADETGNYVDFVVPTNTEHETYKLGYYVIKEV